MNTQFTSHLQKLPPLLPLIGFVALSLGSGSFVSARGQHALSPERNAPAALRGDADPNTCRSGTGWRWVSGPPQPDAAHRAEEALRQRGIAATVAAHAFGETDSCGEFVLFSVDYDVSLRNPALPPGGKQDPLGNQILSILSAAAETQLGNVRIDYGAGNSVNHMPLFHATEFRTPPVSPSRVTTELDRRVYLLVYDPILRDGKRLHTYMGWPSPSTLTDEIINSFLETSNNQLHYSVAYTMDLTDEWPRLIDGYRFTEDTYLQAYANHTPHEPNETDYAYIIQDPRFDLCGKLNRGDIDELWIYGMPFDGTYESRLVGPGAYWYNSPPMDATYGCNRLLPIMGLNYERTVAEAVHSFGHRAEATMSRVYGGWEEDRTDNNWERFALVEAQSPDYSYSGCGSIHFPPNGVTDYDYSNPGTALTNCDDFANYPNLNFPLQVARPVTCTAWNCDGYGYLMYWFGRLPSNVGCGLDGVTNDWWQYVADPNLALYPALTCPPPSCPPIRDWKGEYWNNPWLLGPAVLCRDDPSLSFEWGLGSPDPRIPVDHFSCRWTRTVSFEGGLYRFYILHDDGARIFIDDALAGDFWGASCQTDSVNVELQGGSHTIRVEMFENGGASALKVWWECLVRRVRRAVRRS